MRRHTVLVQHGEGLKQLGVHLAGRQLVHLLLIIVDTLTAGGNLQAAEQQVERQRQLRVLRIVLRVERALCGREVGYEYEIRVVLLLCPLAQQHFFVRVEVVTVLGLMTELLLHDLLGLVEADGRDLLDLRNLGIQHSEFLSAVLLNVSHNGLQHAGLHCHYIVHGINVGHLEVQTHILVQMTGGIVTLCTVNRADLVYTAECTGEVLLVELRGLCQISRSAKVIQLEQVCAALSACNYDLRGVDVGEALRLHVLCKAVSDRTLYAEDRLLARMTQRDRTQRQINIEGQTHILLAERYRQLVVRLAEDGQCAQNDLNAVLCTRLLTNGTGNLEYHCVLDVRTLDAADLVTLEGALNQTALNAHYNKRKVRHIAYTVNRAAERDLAADCFADALYGVNVLTRFMNHFHNITPLCLQFSDRVIVAWIYCRDKVLPVKSTLF